jgi:membrane protease YdiL (CAAX protease family)
VGLCLILVGLPASAPAHDTARLPDPGQPGSHLGYIEQLEHAREAEHARLLARYDAHVAAHPGDVIAAIERCRFVESAESEAEPAPPGDCGAELARRFPGDPEVALYRAESLDHEGVIALEGEVGRSDRWSASQRARLLERVALAYFERGRVDEAFERARRAAALGDPRALGRVLAEGWRRAGERERAIAALLEHADAIQGWEFAPRVETLLELGASAEALALIERARSRSEVWIDPVLRGRAYEAAGRLDEAREQYLAAGEFPWFREAAERRLFELALTRGSASEAREAYLQLRESRGDALARRRLSLARAFPSSPWDARDLKALLALGALLGALASAPLLWVLPLHYVGLRRGRADAVDLDGERRYGPWHLWYAGAVLALAQFTALYVFLYPDLERWLLGQVEPAPARDPSALIGYGLTVGGICALGALLPLRRADWRRVFACRWGLLRTALSCALALAALRATAYLCAELGAAGAASSSASITGDFLRALGERYGTAALLAYAVLLIPLCEEILFRDMMLGAASRLVGFGAASLFQAVLFALLHDSLALAPFYLGVGLVCAELRRGSGGLCAPLIVHAANNALAIAAIT